MYLNFYAIPQFIIGIVCFIYGLVIFLKNKKSRLNQLLALWCFACFIWLLGYTLCYVSKNASLAEVFSRIGCVGVMFLAVFSYHFVVEFLELKKEKRLLYLIYFVNVSLIPFYFLTNYFLSGINKYFFGYYGKASVLYPYYILFFLLIVVRTLYILYNALRENLSSSKRMQTRYVLIGFFVASLASIDFIPKFGIGIYPFGCIFMVAWVFLTSYAIFKHHLIDINIVIRKGLVYSILVAVITFIYLILVLLSEKFLQGLMGYRSLITSIIIALIIALLFNPLRNKIQQFLDKRFFRGTLESLAEERERLKQELFSTEKLAYVGGLASSVVHEIKNPLTAIKTFVEYLPQKYQDPEFKDKFQKLIPQEIERIEKVVHQLLDLAKPRQATFKPVNIVNTIDTTLALLENNLKSKRIEVKKDYETSEIIVSGDEEQLRQVFLNLFLNSIQAMKEGGKLSVGVKSLESNKITVIIEDNGSGISEDNLKKLFTPFFTTKKDGVGLGLTITQEIIRQHNGEIKVESKINLGTRFVIELVA